MEKFSSLSFFLVTEKATKTHNSHLPLALAGSWRRRRTSSLPASPSFLSFMSFISFVIVWLEVSLVLFTIDEILSVVLYDLSCPKLQPQCFGFSTTPFTFTAVLLMLVADFVKVLRFGFLKIRYTFLRWPLPPTCISIAPTGLPATGRYWPRLLTLECVSHASAPGL